MFEGFENMVKDKINSIKQPSSTDITRSAQTYQIKGRTINQLKLLSEGSFGFIWLAQDSKTKQKFALKRIVCINNSRFRLAKNQLDLMMKLPKSKNIVSCFGGQLVTLRSGSVEIKVLVILMEYCPNGTLFELLTSRENKGFSEKQLLNITHSILSGLKDIHKVGVYHQDVKIENVLVGQDKSFKLCDFGSCSNRFIDFKSINKSEYSSIKEQIQNVTTPMYRPPQVVDPYLQYQVGYKCDVWMVGCVLYTLAFFTHPFVDSNAVGIAGGVYRFPRHPQQTQYPVSQKIKDLIRNLLTPNPAFRPSVDQALSLINNWHTVSQIPLNVQAGKRRQQQDYKQRQLQCMHRKVVDIDGDIPIQKLMQLQRKIKDKSAGQQIQTKSFAKDIIKSSNQGKPLFMNVSAKQNVSSQGNQVTKVESSKQKQDTISGNNFWTTTTTNNPNSNTASNTNHISFDDFFGGSSHKPTEKTNKNQAQGDMYDFFFPSDPKNEQKKSQKKSGQDNLLDL